VLTPGARLGPYEIVASVGAGGMGEVYKARDTRLNRVVALKVLAENSAVDSAAVMRFRREAETIAALNHPNICVLHDIGRESTTDFLVMEHLDGESLAERLERGPLKLDDALRIGIDVARALGAAHRTAIVHRDLKPGNIMLTPTGAKLVDFGLAQLKPQAGAAVVRAMTQTLPATAPGTIMGTLPYMAPEQIEGHPADARTDVFALGAVVYEMVTGKRAFPANTAASLIASILEHQPPEITQAIPSAPALLQRVIAKSLAKRPDDRWQAADDVAETLEWVREHQTIDHRERSRAGPWIAAAIAAVAGVAALSMLVARPSGPRETLRLSVVAPPATAFRSLDVAGAPQFALSPDGSRIAFVAGDSNERQRLWVRRLDAPGAQPLAGTEDASMPFWSPDGSSLAYFARGRLKTIAVDGTTAPQDLAGASIDVNGGTWNRDGTILFGAGPGDGLFRVLARGGAAVPETTLDTTHKEVGHRWPQFIDDGRRYLVYIRSYAAGRGGVYLCELGSSERRLLLESPSNAVYVKGELFFSQSGRIARQKVDLDSATLVGEPITLPDQISLLTGPSHFPLSASANGRIAYWTGDRTWTSLEWFDRSGRHISQAMPRAIIDSPELSPDGRSLLFEHGDPGTSAGSSRSLQVIDIGTGVPTRLPFPPGGGRQAIWAPDSADIAFRHISPGASRIVRRTVTGSGEGSVICESDAYWAMMPNTWRGDLVVYQATVARNGWDLGIVRGAGKPVLLITGPGHQVQGQLSPDGRWLAYSSDESGTWEVLVRGMSTGSTLQISAGGSQPRWRSDGSELFYVASGGTLVAVPLRQVGPSLAIAGRPQRLFETRTPPMLAPFRMGFAVTADAQRFVVTTVAPDTPPQVITIIDNLR
jgi:serine/threonine protein kinase